MGNEAVGMVLSLGDGASCKRVAAGASGGYDYARE